MPLERLVCAPGGGKRERALIWPNMVLPGCPGYVKWSTGPAQHHSRRDLEIPAAQLGVALWVGWCGWAKTCTGPVHCGQGTGHEHMGPDRLDAASHSFSSYAHAVMSTSRAPKGPLQALWENGRSGHEWKPNATGHSNCTHNRCRARACTVSMQSNIVPSLGADLCHPRARTLRENAQGKVGPAERPGLK